MRSCSAGAGADELPTGPPPVLNDQRQEDAVTQMDNATRVALGRQENGDHGWQGEQTVGGSAA